MNKYAAHFAVWKRYALIPLLLSIAAGWHTWDSVMKQFYAENVINLSIIISGGFVTFCCVMMSFVIWYTGWYYSDSAVRTFARRAKNWFGREWIDEKLGTHPRKEEIIQEYEKLTRQ